MRVSDLQRGPQRMRSVGEGALIRLPIDEAHWAELIPPIPTGFDVTVSFSSSAVAAEHGDALQMLGYTVVGLHQGPVVSAMFLVSQALLESHPTYWRSLAALADAAYSLSLGPALRLLDDVLRVHMAGRPS